MHFGTVHARMRVVDISVLAIAPGIFYYCVQERSQRVHFEVRYFSYCLQTLKREQSGRVVSRQSDRSDCKGAKEPSV